MDEIHQAPSTISAAKSSKLRNRQSQIGWISDRQTGPFMVLLGWEGGGGGVGVGLLGDFGVKCVYTDDCCLISFSKSLFVYNFF